MRWGVAVAIACFGGGCNGCPGTASQQAPPRAPLEGEIVDVDGLRLNLRCEGEGAPVVAFESGLGADGSVWRSVQTEVARVTRACAHDRAGLGRSSPPPHPHGQRQMARELRALLREAGEPGPYVLVGHSMGAANARWFLQDHADDVTGMVLVDATTAESFRHHLAQVPESEADAFWSNVRRLEGLDRESMLSGYEGLRTDRALGDSPLAILTAGKPETELSARRQWQGALAALSSNSVHVTANESGHNVHLDQPALVVGAAVAVVRAARAKGKLTEEQISEGAAPSRP
jgi:pimeloyl-ACP methyl ester carboxylesterase